MVLTKYKSREYLTDKNELGDLVESVQKLAQALGASHDDMEIVGAVIESYPDAVPKIVGATTGTAMAEAGIQHGKDRMCV